MKTIVRPLLAALFATLFAAAPPARAGAYADAMGHCLVEATNERERAELARWVFGTAALHPDVAAVSALTPAQRDAQNRAAAALIQRLITENCAYVMKGYSEIARRWLFTPKEPVAHPHMESLPAARNRNAVY